jgi:hypothetical protein
MSGYHRTYISMLERAKMNPSLRTMLSIASAPICPQQNSCSKWNNCLALLGGAN